MQSPILSMAIQLIALCVSLMGSKKDPFACLLYTGILYDCNELETSCSSCLGRNVAGFTCGWCSNECVVTEECSDTFFTTTAMCPLPIIDSVQPNRGPTAGGTRVNISGTDLGASYSDVIEVSLQSVTGTSVSCLLAGEETYVLGRGIVCVTPSVMFGGNYVLKVLIQRESITEVVSAPYSYEEPRLTAVHPAFGPKSGGIEVVISGSSLSIGNIQNTCIQLNGVDCEIMT